MNRPRVASIVVWGLGVALAGGAAPSPALGQLRAVRQPAGPLPGGAVALPYMVPDNAGNQWRFYPQYFQQSGNTPLYSQGAMLFINGNQPQLANPRQARTDEKTGEVVIEGMNANGLAVTRRVLFDRDANLVRFIDVVKNGTAQDQAINLMVQSSMNYGIQASQMVPDPKRKDQNVGWVAQTHGNGAVMEVYSGKNAKTPMTIAYQQGNNQVQANLQTTVKPGQEVAVMHLHGVQPSQDAAARYAAGIKEQDILKKVPVNLRKILVNFPGGGSFVGDVEVLRGDLLDVVELRGGDQLKGTLKEERFDLTTFYGPVSLPVDRVIALLNVGTFRPRQLVVTADGQIFGGTVKQEAVSLQLSSGQVTKVPLSQVSRVGYRRRAGEPEEWTFDKPLVLMRTGERVGVRMPGSQFEVATRYGKLAIDPKQLAAVVLQSEDAGLHTFTLTDGSRFSGLLAADALEMTLDTGGGPDQVVRFPVSSVARFQLTPKVAEPDDATPTLKLANEDVLVGTVAGQLKIDTSFDTIDVTAAEVRELRKAKDGATDVQVTLFDGSTVSGQLQQMELPVRTAGGLEVRVPLALLDEYVQPQPTPSKQTEDKIIELIKNLSAEDWKARDRAQQALVQMGPVSIAALKKLREGQPAEAQQRIDTIVKELEKQKGGSGSKPAAP